MKLKDIWHVGCLFGTILVKEVVIDFKDIFWDPTSPPGPFLGGRGALKGSRGSKLKLQDRWHVGCLFITILVKEVLIVSKDILWDPAGPPGPYFGGYEGGLGVLIKGE